MKSLNNINDYIDAKKRVDKHDIPDADIRSLNDIKLAIEPFLPRNDDSRTITISSNTDEMRSIKDDKLAKNSIVSAKISQLSPRGLLLEGLELANKHAMVPKTTDDDIYEFGGYIPAEILAGKHRTWVDWLIKKKLGGTRDGMKIFWIIDDKKYVFDPVTGVIS